MNLATLFSNFKNKFIHHLKGFLTEDRDYIVRKELKKVA